MFTVSGVRGNSTQGKSLTHRIVDADAETPVPFRAWVLTPGKNTELESPRAAGSALPAAFVTPSLSPSIGVQLGERSI